MTQTNSITIRNTAGETMATASSDFEAVRWYGENGRYGDYLAETGERLHELARSFGFTPIYRTSAVVEMRDPD